MSAITGAPNFHTHSETNKKQTISIPNFDNGKGGGEKHSSKPFTVNPITASKMVISRKCRLTDLFG